MTAYTLIVTFDDHNQPEEPARLRNAMLQLAHQHGHTEATTVTVETWLYQDQLRPPEPRRPPIVHSTDRARSRRKANGNQP